MLITAPQGDLHNFNRSVYKVALKDGAFFKKPRPVIWETLFFGNKSPLKNIFSNTAIQMELNQLASSGFFENDMLEVSKSDRAISESDFYCFGQLLGYCYYFGIQDIHKDNIIISDKGIQVIDVENAFSNFILPNQSLLLPANKEITWSAGLNLLTKDNLGELSQVYASNIIEGFVFISEYFYKHWAQIKMILLQNKDTFINYPIRVFFRGTKEYTEHLKGIAQIQNLFEEETIQLVRNDVPYFFKIIGKSDVFYYTTNNWTFEKARIPAEFHKYANHLTDNLEVFFNPEKFERQWGSGLLYLVNKMKNLNTEKLAWDMCSVIFDAYKMYFQGPNIKMATNYLSRP